MDYSPDEKAGEDDSEVLAEARRVFDRCEDAEEDNRREGLESIEFSRLGKQWPSDIEALRKEEGRPCLTINKMEAFIRQVVNDARQNKPAIRVSPVDDGADIETAKVIGGLIRNIEQQSNADIAYDTAIENAVQYWVGYIRVDVDYASEDSFDLDLKINRVLNPSAVYGDPDSTSADGSDWNVCFVTEAVSADEYKRRYGDKAKVSFNDSAWDGLKSPWRTDTHVMIAEWWTREAYERRIFLLSTGITVSEEQLLNDPDMAGVGALIEAGEISVIDERTVTAYKVRQRVVSGVEVLEDNEWPGKFIPIIPVYGDEFNIEGKRYIRSLVHSAMDAQRMFNYWRTTATELVALAPRVPYIGEEGTFDADPQGWATANTVSHAYLEYTAGKQPPQRQQLDIGAAAGALQEALNANDDMKAILGIYDASLGARSNETSGRAILARQREGDVSTFHFIDNLSRSIRQVGRVLGDLIPHVYSGRKILRVLGEDGTVENVPLNQERVIERPGQDPIMAVHDLAAGKYDYAVSAGPSFTTKRMENAYNMIEFARAVPNVGTLMVDKIAKAQDWDGADEIAERAKALLPGGGENNLPPQVMEQMQAGQMAMQELQTVRTDRSIDMAKLDIERFKAETDRMKVQAEMEKAGIELGIKAAQS